MLKYLKVFLIYDLIVGILCLFCIECFNRGIEGFYVLVFLIFMFIFFTSYIVRQGTEGFVTGKVKKIILHDHLP